MRPQGFDIAASFGPDAIVAGAPGIAVLFAIASMFGFESTAIYAGEARDPQRTVPRATYLSVSLIAVFFAFIMWVAISYYGGAGGAQEAALGTLATDPGDFVLVPIGAVLGGWAADLTSVLLCTSLLAGLLAFHNIVNRYLHAMAEHDELPRQLSRTNRHQAPAVAAAAQSVTVVLVMAWFMIGDKNPVATLFGWLSGTAVAALVVLYVLVSVSIIRYFRSHRVHANLWTTAVAPRRLRGADARRAVHHREELPDPHGWQRDHVRRPAVVRPGGDASRVDGLDGLQASSPRRRRHRRRDGGLR